MKYIFVSVLAASLGIIAACSSGQKPEDQQDKLTSSSESNTTDLDEELEDDGKQTILFFGNSLSAGYGLDDPEHQSFPGIIQQKIDSLNLPFKVVNAGLSGETTSGGKNRIDWVLKQKIDVFVLELGGNDGLRGIKPDESKKNLQSIIDQVKAKYPEVKILLAGMEAPPNMGEDFTSAFREMYPVLAEANQVALLPFLLQGVGGETHLNQADGIHPNIEGHRIVAENVWEILLPLIDENESI